MKRTFAILAIALLALPIAAKKPLPEIKITWDEPTMLTEGGYARIHPLSDGSLMAVYSHGADTYMMRGNADGTQWESPRCVFKSADAAGAVPANVANAEFAQLSKGNPHAPGRIIYAANLRPQWQKSSQRPYSIAIIFSDDNGLSWSSPEEIYLSSTWDKDVLKGCYEPFILELPDGTVQIYFADETPYYKEKLNYQNISVIESKDGGKTWSAPRIACYTEGQRDGMPVGMIHDGWTYVAVEACDLGLHFRPQIVCSPSLKSWGKSVPAKSGRRFNPLLTPLESHKVYAGAPYLAKTENFIILSWQTSDGAAQAGTEHATMEMAFCPISELKSHKFNTMRGNCRPFAIDRENDRALWNAICPLGGDDFLAITEWNGRIFLRHGHVSI